MIIHISRETNYIDSTRQYVWVRKSKSSMNVEIIQKSGDKSFDQILQVYLLYLEIYKDFNTI